MMNLPAVTINSELNTETILSFLDSCFNMDSTGDSGGGGENCLDPRQRYGRKPSNDPLRQLQESTQALWDRMAAIEQILYLNQASNSVNSMQNGIVEKHHEHIGREPKLRELDFLCGPEFARNPFPTNNEQSRMVSRLLPRYPSAGNRAILAAIRKWYRKKRDENGQKVFHACTDFIKPMIDSGTETAEVNRRLEEDLAFRQAMLRAASLDIEDEDNAFLFLQTKVEAYFKRRVSQDKL